MRQLPIYFKIFSLALAKEMNFTLFWARFKFLTSFTHLRRNLQSEVKGEVESAQVRDARA
jgi:hypothetical protein